MREEVKLLLKRWEEHGKIILGVDFDNTVFPYTEGDDLIAARCKVVVELVKRAKPFAHICLWTLGDYWSVRYKEEIMILYGLKPDFVNSSPFEVEGARKPYFNLLLDDNAGLNEAMEILEEFIQEATLISATITVSGSDSTSGSLDINQHENLK